MLVLSRKTNETIRVGNNVTITILKARGNTVRLGIEAPRDVRVMRGEIAHVAHDDSGAQDDDDQPVPECSTIVPMRSRCVAESLLDPSEDTKCAAEYEGDRWNVSSMKRRVKQVCAQRRAASA